MLFAGDPTFSTGPLLLHATASYFQSVWASLPDLMRRLYVLTGP